MGHSIPFYSFLRLSILCLASNYGRLFASSSPLYLPASIRASHHGDISIDASEPQALSRSQLYFDIGCAAVLVLVGGVFAGLTIAYVYHINIISLNSSPFLKLCESAARVGFSAPRYTFFQLLDCAHILTGIRDM